VAILDSIANAGQRLDHLGACEGGAGNISVLLPDISGVPTDFPNAETVPLPIAVPELAGRSVLVTGSGCRLRELQIGPADRIALMTIEDGGTTAVMRTSANRVFTRVTSEFNTHLAVHRHAVAADSAEFQALVHAQPPYLTYLSHIPAYQSAHKLNRALMRWQPETVVFIRGGFAYVPFEVFGTPELCDATISAANTGASVLLWAKHGILTRSAESVETALDIIEYAEASARTEYMDLCAGGRGEGLSLREIRKVAQTYGINTEFLDR